MPGIMAFQAGTDSQNMLLSSLHTLISFSSSVACLGDLLTLPGALLEEARQESPLVAVEAGRHA